jgi:acyl-CoA thioesterase-1
MHAPAVPPRAAALCAAALALGAFAGCRSEPAPAAAPPPADTVAVAEPAAPAPAPPECVEAALVEATAPRPDTLTAVFFGDSLTEGYGLAGGKDEAYPALVEARAEAEGLPLRVVNAGVSGNTSADGRARVGWALRQARPDVFVLALGANDGLRGLDAGAMGENLRAVLCAARAANPAVRFVVLGMEAPPNYGAAYTDRYRAVFADLAEEFDAAFVPFLLDRVAGVAALNQPDRIHPTPEGQRIMAETVWDALAPVLREEAARPVG